MVDYFISLVWIIGIIPFFVFIKWKFPSDDFDGLNLVCEMVGSILWPFMILGYVIVIMIIKYKDWRNYVKEHSISYSNFFRHRKSR